MKRALLFATLLSATAAGLFAQAEISKLITGNQDSPEAITAMHFGEQGKMVWIFYHSPAVKGRHIFNGAGALQPDESIWRLGADYATVLHTDGDLDLNGLAVPKGDYTVYAYLDKGNWKLILNKQLMNARGTRPQWGVLNAKNDTTNDPAKELGRVDLTMGKAAQPVERLKIALTRVDNNRGKIEIAWENVTAAVPFTVK